MTEHVVTMTRDRKPDLDRLIRSLPAMLAGHAPDVGGIAAGFKARLGFAFISLVKPNFDDLGNGKPGVDGTKWPPLSEFYLAYGRGPANTRHAGGLAPGGKDGFLSKEQLALWKRTYADRLAFFVMREPDDKAKSHAAAIAWIIVKAAGAKTKLKEFGQNKVAGADYQMMVDRGTIRNSLQPGQLSERGAEAEYATSHPNQVYRAETGEIVAGTNVAYAAANHAAKNPKRRRPFWPAVFPADWWRQILGQATGGLSFIGELCGGSR